MNDAKRQMIYRSTEALYKSQLCEPPQEQARINRAGASLFLLNPIASAPTQQLLLLPRVEAKAALCIGGLVELG